MQTNQTQSKRFGLPAILMALAVFAAFAFITQGLFGRVPVVLDGNRASVGVGDTVNDAITQWPALAPAGDVLAATDHRIVLVGGGEPPTVSINGRPSALGSRIAPGDKVELSAGGDVIEATVEETRVIAIPSKIVGQGAVLTMVSAGAVGVQRVTVGAVSGDIVASETVLPAEPMVLRRVSGGGKKVVALTFDDGPWPGQTAKILDILKAEKVPATFFPIGLRVKREPGLAKRIVAEGHALGNHTYRHIDLTGTKPDILRREIRGTNDMVRWTTGVQPKWFRPPMGQVDGPAYKEIAAAGLKPVLWTIDPQDWRKGAEAGRIAKSVIAAAKPGSVILLHDGGGDRAQTIKALPWIIHELKKKGYEFVLLDDLPNAPKSRW